MPAAFGSNSTWLKGTVEGADGVTYFNLYQIQCIALENENDYVIQLGGHRFRILNCVVAEDLTEIEPPGGG